MNVLTNYTEFGIICHKGTQKTRKRGMSMIDGVKLPVEEYALNYYKMALLSDDMRLKVALKISEKRDVIAKEQGLSDEDAYELLLKRYKQMKREQFLPVHYVIEDDPDMFSKIIRYGQQGISDVSVLSKEEYDKRNAFMMTYMLRDDVM